MRCETGVGMTDCEEAGDVRASERMLASMRSSLLSGQGASQATTVSCVVLVSQPPHQRIVYRSGGAQAHSF